MIYSDELKHKNNIIGKLKNNLVLYDIIIAVLLRDLNKMIYAYSANPNSNHLSNANYILKDLDENWLGDFIDIRDSNDYNIDTIATWLVRLKMLEYSVRGGHESDDKDGPIKYATCNLLKEIMEKYEL